jgi:hypothetical protein
MIRIQIIRTLTIAAAAGLSPESGAAISQAVDGALAEQIGRYEQCALAQGGAR